MVFENNGSAHSFPLATLPASDDLTENETLELSFILPGKKERTKKDQVEDQGCHFGTCLFNIGNFIENT